jgi:hypothetical protein
MRSLLDCVENIGEVAVIDKGLGRDTRGKRR